MPAAGANSGGAPSGGLGAIYLAGGQCFGIEGTWYLVFVIGGAVGTGEVSWDVSLSGGWSHTIVSATGPVLVVQVYSGWWRRRPARR